MVRFLLNLLLAAVALAASSTWECSPLAPTPEKQAAVHAYKQGLAPIFFWHIQKAGGTSFCSLLMDRHGRNTTEFRAFSYSNCNNKAIATDLVLRFEKAWPPLQRRKFIFIGHEPSDHDTEYPKNYHAGEAAKVLLDESYDPKRHALAWSKMVHIVVFRHPLELMLSAMSYTFNFAPRSVRENCAAHKLSLDGCFQEMFRLVKHPEVATHKFFNAFQIHLIRDQLLGNYTINYFSLHNDLNEAKALLRKFSVVMDFSSDFIGHQLLQCTLGWWDLNHIGRHNVNLHTAKEANRFANLSNDTLWMVQWYLRHEIELYDYAVGLSSQHHIAALHEYVASHKSDE